MLSTLFISGRGLYVHLCTECVVLASYLLQNGLPLLAVGDRGQLHVSHLLHLLVHVYLLLQLADFGLQQSHRVFPVVLPSQSCGARRVDCRDPVFQLCLTRGLTRTEKTA